MHHNINFTVKWLTQAGRPTRDTRAKGGHAIDRFTRTCAIGRQDARFGYLMRLRWHARLQNCPRQPASQGTFDFGRARRSDVSWLIELEPPPPLQLGLIWYKYLPMPTWKYHHLLKFFFVDNNPIHPKPKLQNVRQSGKLWNRLSEVHKILTITPLLHFRSSSLPLLSLAPTESRSPWPPRSWQLHQL